MNSAKKRTLLTIALAAVTALFVVGATVRSGISHLLLQGDADGGQNCFTNLACIEATTGTFSNLYSTNGFFQNVYVSNLYVTNLTVQILNVSNVFLNGVVPSGYNPDSGYVLASTQRTNYVIDFGTTNMQGQTNLFGSIDATNDVNLAGFANGGMWKLFEINIIAHGGTRLLTITNAWHNFVDVNGARFDTNGAGSTGQGWIASGNYYTYYLSNNNEIVIAMQSNSPAPCPDSNQLSFLWSSKGQ